MKKARYIFGAAILCVAGVLHFSQPASSAPGTSPYPSPDRGMQVFQAYCVGCHGPSAKGDGPMASPLVRDFGVRPTDLTSGSYTAQKSAEELKAAILGGGKAVHRTAYMPAWSQTLSEGQVDDLVAYIREIQFGNVVEEPSFVNVGDKLELGRVLYTIRCLACHGLKGQGDGIFIEGLKTGTAGVKGLSMPDFSKDRFFSERTDLELENLIKQGVKHTHLKTEPGGWWDDNIDQSELDALVLYLRTIPLAEKQRRS